MTANPNCSDDSQYGLQGENESTIRFSTVINGIPCTIHGASPHAGFGSAVLPADSCQSNPVTNSRAKHQLTSIDELPNKYQKSLQGHRLHAKTSAQTTHYFNRDAGSDGRVIWNSLSAAQQSYRTALKDGRLKFDRELRLLSLPKESLWDPYILTPQSLRHAQLDEEKLQTIAESIESITEFVPKAGKWDAKVREHILTPEDVHTILQTAFAQFSKQPEQDNKLSPRLNVIAKVLRSANELKKKRSTFQRAELKKKRDTFRRAETVLRMIAYALMEVSGKAAKNEVELLASYGAKRLKQWGHFARVWFWMMEKLPGWKGRDLPLLVMLVEQYGESALRELFPPTVPAKAGEFVSALSSKEYCGDLPATRSPGLIQVVMLLGGVNHEAMSSTFGCSVSYLEGLDPDLVSEEFFWEEATGASGQQDQTKKDGHHNTDPGLDDTDPGPDNTDPGLDDTDPGLDNIDLGLDNTDPGLNDTDPGLDNIDLDLGLDNTDPEGHPSFNEYFDTIIFYN